MYATQSFDEKLLNVQPSLGVTATQTTKAAGPSGRATGPSAKVAGPSAKVAGPSQNRPANRMGRRTNTITPMSESSVATDNQPYHISSSRTTNGRSTTHSDVTVPSFRSSTAFFEFFLLYSVLFQLLQDIGRDLVLL